MSEQKGTVGLTYAGQLLDEYLTIRRPHYAHKITRFIHKFTSRIKRIRTLTQNDNRELDYLLEIIRNDYIKKAKIAFRNILNRYVFSLLINYIKTLTKKEFIPHTITQRNLLKNQNQN